MTLLFFGSSSSPGTAKDTVAAAPGQVTVDLARPGNVSAAIYGKDGRMVRELARAVPMQAGKQSIEWDGLDMDGRPVAAGTYDWKLLQTQGLKSEYLMSVGTSVGQRWWPGNHSGPSVIAAAEDSFIVGAMPEGPPLLTRVGLDGKVIWECKDFEPARNPYDVAIGGGKAFYLQDNGKIFVLDLATGQAPGGAKKNVEWSALFPVKTFFFGQGAGGQGETPVPLVPLVPSRENPEAGWDDVSGMTGTAGGITCDALTARTFEAAMPNGQYLLRFSYGDDTQPTTLVEVQPNGLAPSPGHYSLPGKMAWWQLPVSGADAKTTPIFLPQVYGLPRAVPVKDGRLRIKFIPESPRAKVTKAHWGLRKIEVMATADRIAADADTSVLSSKGAEKIVWIDPNSGSVLDSMNLPDVRDVAMGPNHTVFALLADSVVSFTRESKSPQTRITGLVDPVAFDVDTKTGAIFVAEGGALQRVKAFDAAGKLIATHGREGGRKQGRYEPRDFASLSGIASDGHGGFIVTERYSVPRRTARFDAAGNVLREWFGGMDFYATTSLDPADPTIGWLRQQDEQIVQIKLDYAKREWRPIAAWRWTEAFDPAGGSTGDAVFQTRMSYGPWLQRNATHHRMRVLRHDINVDGKPELLIEFTTLPLLLVHDEKSDRLRPLACLGLIDPSLWAEGTTAGVDQLPAAWAEAIRLAGGDPADVKSRIKYARYSWADENGDGVIDANELHLGEAKRGVTSPTGPNGGFCLRVDQWLNAWVGSGSTDKAGMYLIYKPERITACGAPVWPLQGVAAGPKTERRGETRSLLPVRDGGAFALLGGNGDGTKSSGTYDVAVHGWSWPSTLTDGMALLRLDADGKTLWRSATKAARWPHPRGQLHGAWHLGHEIKGCVPVFDWLEQPCEFWTTDGLYVGGLFDGRDPMDGHELSVAGSKPDPLYTWHGIRAKRIGGNHYFGENSLLAADDLRTGGETAELPDGSVVFLGQGANNNPCYRITGWDDWVRLSGEVRIDKPVADTGKGTGLTGEIFDNTDLAGAPIATRTDDRLWFGKDKPWPKEAPAKNFSVRWSGFLEPRFTEDYCLSIYARGDFKLWVDGKEVAWAKQDYPRDKEIRKGHSVPISLRAGTRVPVMIEYRATMPDPAFHLNWESLSQPVEHIPQTFLYPQS